MSCEEIFKLQDKGLLHLLKLCHRIDHTRHSGGRFVVIGIVVGIFYRHGEGLVVQYIRMNTPGHNPVLQPVIADNVNGGQPYFRRSDDTRVPDPDELNLGHIRPGRYRIRLCEGNAVQPPAIGEAPVGSIEITPGHENRIRTVCSQ